MTRSLVLAILALMAMVSLAPAQSYTYPSENPDNAATLNRSFIRGYLRREPAPSERSPMETYRGGSPEFIKSAYLASEDYFLRAGGTRPTYVRQLYLDVIGREPLPAEINYWAGRLSYESRRDVAYRLLRFHPRNVFGIRPAPRNYDPGFFPDPTSPTFRDPSGAYYHSPYFFNYEKSRGIRAFMLDSQG